MVVNGSLSKTAVNGDAGANTQLSGLVVAVLTVVTLLFLTGLFTDLPEATLAAVVIAAVIELVDIGALKRLYRASARSSPGRLPDLTARPDFLAAATALAGVLIFGTLPGLAIGVSVSFVLLLYRASRPRVARLGEVPPHSGQYTDIARHPDNLQHPGIAVVRVEAGLFFANADLVRTRLLHVTVDPDIRAIVLDAETIAFIDVTAAEMLARVADELKERNVQLVIAHGISAVRHDLRVNDDGSGRIELFATVEEAVAAAAG
jgi:MFS superfamily sulfate permease-like transporter